MTIPLAPDFDPMSQRSVYAYVALTKHIKIQHKLHFPNELRL